MRDEVLQFIEQFQEAREVFLRGMCYWFAVILESRFFGTIYYLPVMNHFVTRIIDRYYDASGDVTDTLDETPYEWDVYRDGDPRHVQRIVKDCILKIKDEEERLSAQRSHG